MPFSRASNAGHPATAVRSAPLPRILLVDDDAAVLASAERALATRADTVAVRSYGDALAALDHAADFAVIVSDLHLGDHDGIAVLTEAARRLPFAVRILMSGDADIAEAVRAINSGHVFRFIQKPFLPSVIQAQVDAALTQHRLLTAERDLLGQTLSGAIRALSEVLALTSPTAFGRSQRLHRLVSDCAAAAGITDPWALQSAALLSSVGLVTLPTSLVDRFLEGAELDRSEQALIHRLPQVEEQLIASIPRLEAVREILRCQHLRFDGVGNPDAPKGAALPVGARILRIAADYDHLQCQARDVNESMVILRQRPGVYDPQLLGVFEKTLGFLGPGLRLLDVRLIDVELGMVFAEDVRTESGVLFIARGQDVTPSLISRILGSWPEFAGQQRVRMIGKA